MVEAFAALVRCSPLELGNNVFISHGSQRVAELDHSLLHHHLRLVRRVGILAVLEAQTPAIFAPFGLNVLDRYTSWHRISIKNHTPYLKRCWHFPAAVHEQQGVVAPTFYLRYSIALNAFILLQGVEE